LSNPDNYRREFDRLNRKVKDNDEDIEVALKEIKSAFREIRKINATLNKIERLAYMIGSFAGVTSGIGAYHAASDKFSEYKTISNIINKNKNLTPEDKLRLLEEVDIPNVESVTPEQWREMSKSVESVKDSTKINSGFTVAQVLWLTSFILQVATTVVNLYEQKEAERKIREREKLRQDLRREFVNQLLEGNKQFRGDFSSGVPT